jgi:hypothetical protein
VHSPDIATAAKIIAENVVSAVEHGRHGIGGFKHPAHAAAVTELMRALLCVMPTDESTVLADIFAAMGLTGPRVEAVDGSVTMRQG